MKTEPESPNHNSSCTLRVNGDGVKGVNQAQLLHVSAEQIQCFWRLTGASHLEELSTEVGMTWTVGFSQGVVLNHISSPSKSLGCLCLCVDTFFFFYTGCNNASYTVCTACGYIHVCDHGEMCHKYQWNGYEGQREQDRRQPGVRTCLWWLRHTCFSFKTFVVPGLSHTGHHIQQKSAKRQDGLNRNSQEFI